MGLVEIKAPGTGAGTVLLPAAARDLKEGCRTRWSADDNHEVL